MTKEQEAIERLNRFKTIEVLYSNTFAMHIEQLKTVQEDIETALNMLKEKDKQIDLMLDKIDMTKPSPCTMTNEYSIGRVYMSKEEKKQYFENKVKE